MGIFGPKGARLVFSCVSAVGATKIAPQADWDLQYSADALTAVEFETRRIAPASSSLTPTGLSTPADEMRRRNRKNPNDIQVPIFYATNREQLSAGDGQRHPRKFFGQVTKTTPGLSFGLGRVRIREDAFKLANLQDERDARRLEEIKPCQDEAEWKKKLREAINGDVKKSIVVFVHGCFTDFPRGLEYGGLVKHGCNFSGPVIVFSWPSIGHKVQSRPYAKDEKTVKWSVPQLKEFLHMLLTDFEAKVHILSYSMGARVVIGALDLLEEEMLAIDEKLKREGGELRARVQERIRGVVTRSEQAAAGIKVGVRELGSILAQERDLLKERVTQSTLDAQTKKVRSVSSQAAGYESGVCVTYGSKNSRMRRIARLGKISPRLEGQQASTLDGGDRTQITDEGSDWGVDGVASRSRISSKVFGQRASTSDGVNNFERDMNDDDSDRVIGGVNDDRVKKWEALRSKLGHLIFMAPDEDVVRFRHTARRWTRRLRNHVSGDADCGNRVCGNPVSVELGKERVGGDSGEKRVSGEPVGGNRVTGEPQGTSEAVKERVRSGLEVEGPEAVEEAAKRGERKLVDDDVVGRNADVSKRSDDVSGALDSISVGPNDVIVTPELSAWREMLGGDGRQSANQLGSSNPPPHLLTIFSGKALDQNPKPQFLAGFPTTDRIHQGMDPEAQPTVDINPLAAKQPSIGRRRSAPTVLISAAVGIEIAFPATNDVTDPTADVMLSTGGVGFPFSGAASSYPGQENCGATSRATSPASTASSRSFSRSSSSTDLVGEELQQALLWEHLHASGSDACSDRSSDASSRASSRPPSRTSSMADISTASNGCNASESDLGTGDGHALISEKAPFRRRSLPALGLHLSTSAPILNSDALEWRFLQSLPRPTGARQLSDAGAGESPSTGPFPSQSDEQSEVHTGEERIDDVTGPRFSLYTSQSDWALKLAGLATTKPWARGLARMVAFGEPGQHDLGIRVGATLVVEDGFETVDATEVSIGSRNMGHHYLFHRCILEDITHLLSGANAHKRRFEAITPNGQVYWKIERGDYKPASQPSPALYPSWSSMILESSKVAPADLEQQLVYFARDSAAIDSIF